MLLRQLSKILLIVILGFLFYPLSGQAAASPIVITEIAAYPTGNLEWLEIYNRGAEALDMTNWKFFEDETNHKLTVFQGNFIVEPAEYAIIANQATEWKNSHPDFNGTILDSSWTSLNQAGEEIGLKNAALEPMEVFTYLACPQTSLQRIDFNSDDYSETNWQVHPSSDSAGQANEFTQDEEPPVDEGDDEEPLDDTDDYNEPPAQPEVITPGTIVINELVSDPLSGQAEWLELYNKSSEAIDLTDWLIEEGSGSTTTLSGKITANFYFVIEKPKGMLNNDGDTVILKDQLGNVIDEMVYGEWGDQIDNAPAATDPNSLARIKDGYDTGNNSADFVITRTSTKGTTNKITSPLITADNEDPDESNQSLPTVAVSKIDYGSLIQINEILPQPEAVDLAGEFIELKNISQQPVDLQGWQLEIKSKLTYKITSRDFSNFIIPPQGFLVISRKISGLALNNDKDVIKLIAPNNKIVQTLKYEEDIKLNKEAAYALDELGDWWWTTTKTPGQANLITKLNHPPVIKIYCPSQAFVSELVICDASDTYDLENDPLNFAWQIDQQITENIILTKQFSEEGTFYINLTVTDKTSYNQYSQKIKISALPAEDGKTETKVKTTKATTTKKTTKVSQTKAKAAQAIDLSDLNNLELNSLVQTQGIVSALPNTFGKTIMYLAGSGTQLYMYKANWPNLKIGDIVSLNGTVTESSGQRRIKLADAADLQVIGQEDPPLAKEINIAELDNSLLAYLVKIKGQLIEKKNSTFFIQDESGEAEVYLKANAKINRVNFLEGDQLTVIGIVGLTSGRLQIWPRSNEDISKIEAEKEKQEIIEIKENENSNKVIYYLLVGLGILGIVGMVIYLKNKNSKLKIEEQK